MIETSKALKDLFYKYTHLTLGGKKIRCPYWVNKIKKGLVGPLGGKGTPEQIVDVAEYQANKDGFDFQAASEEEIINFLLKKKIGVDCSGFAFWMLNALDLAKGGDGIANDITGSKGRFISARANVAMLTDEKVSIPVELKEARVGDMIQLRGRKHVAIITKIFKDGEEIRAIEYCHSSCLTEINGVHSSEVKIINPQGSLKDQLWKEKTKDGENYGTVSFLEQLGDGLRRLKIWA